MEQRVGVRSTDTLVEQDEHEGRFNPLLGQAVAVAASDTFEQAMGLHLEEVVAELGERIGGGGEGGEDGLMDVGARPSV
jgi:hypothetical protein